MEYFDTYKGQQAEITDLFTATFTDSEGAEEGGLIGGLARRLLADTPDGDIHVFTAWQDGVLAGAIVFTRLSYDQDDRIVFVLAPVAVATSHQGQGVGQGLLTHGLEALRSRGIDIAVTYGDPKYYARVGFAPIREDQAAAPFRLQFPEGWLAQSLTGAGLAPLTGPSRCVAALNDPVYW